MKNRTVVEKIIKYADKILDYTKNMTYADFVENSILVEACVFNLSQIGELANKIDNDFEQAHTNIPWRMMYGLRNKIVHDYDGVNLVLIWDIVNDDLAELNTRLKELYKTI